MNTCPKLITVDKNCLAYFDLIFARKKNYIKTFELNHIQK